MNILTENRVLKLNGMWKPVGVTTVQEAFKAMSRLRQKHYSEKMKIPWNAMHIEYPVENGSVNYTSPLTVVPVGWADWIELPIRFYDKYVSTPNLLIRVPTVIIAQNYSKIPTFEVSYSKHAVWKRDNSTCQITGEKVSKKTGNIEHWVAKKHGGQTTFENTYVVKKEINQLKGDLTPEEFYNKYGYKKPSSLKKPNRQDILYNNNFDIPDWKIFTK